MVLSKLNDEDYGYPMTLYGYGEAVQPSATTRSIPPVWSREGANGQVDVAGGECVVTKDPVLIAKARQLTTTEYLRRGFITSEEVNEDGVQKSDPYHEHSTYYVVTPDGGENVVATVRIINHDPSKGRDSFPLLVHEQELNPDMMDKIEHIGVENLVEVSALVRDREASFKRTAAMKLYKKIFTDAWREDGDGKSAFIMACNPRLFEDFRFLFGDSMERIGPDLKYTGQDAVPTLFACREGAVRTIEASSDPHDKNHGVRRDIVNYFLSGSNVDEIHPDIIDALQRNGYDELLARMRDGDWDSIEKREQRAMRGIKRAFLRRKGGELGRHYRPEIIAGAGLVGYTALRTAAVAGGIPDADWRVFLGIELATTPTYVWAMGDLVRHAGDKTRRLGRRLGAQAVAAISFVAPYGYLLGEGAMDSHQGTTVVGGLLAIGAVPAIGRSIKKAVGKRRAKKSQGHEKHKSDV